MSCDHIEYSLYKVFDFELVFIVEDAFLCFVPTAKVQQTPQRRDGEGRGGHGDWTFGEVRPKRRIQAIAKTTWMHAFPNGFYLQFRIASTQISVL